MAELITIKNDLLSLDLAPECGGAIAAFRGNHGEEVFDLMRPATGEALQDKDPLLTACFPLVPFSNRIEKGTFTCGDREVRLHVNMPPHPHPLHGQGWRHPWQVVDLSGDGTELVYRHSEGDDGWPWEYTASQHFLLAENRLKITLKIQNDGIEEFPVGLGLHPYFPLSEDTILVTGLTALWQTDALCIPRRELPLPESLRFQEGCTLDGLVLDHCFSGWNRRALIRWPSKNIHMNLTADDSLCHCVIFIPKGEDFFCFEPVSNVTNAFNMTEIPSEKTGFRRLGPGENFVATVQFEVFGLSAFSFSPSSSER